jgi:hypothetical protein
MVSVQSENNTSCYITATDQCVLSIANIAASVILGSKEETFPEGCQPGVAELYEITS